MQQLCLENKDFKNDLQLNFSYKFLNKRAKISGKSSYSNGLESTTTAYTEGQLSDIKILRGLSKTIAEECLRVAETLPKKWIPAKKNGKNIAINYILPIKLKIPRPSEPSVLENNEN